MLPKKWIRVGLIAGGIAGITAIAAKIYIWRKGNEEEVVEVNPPYTERVTDEYKTSISLAKPDLTELANDIIKSEGYAYPKSEEEAEKMNENSPHICSEKDYVETYVDYDHHTCTWYPDEKRLVDLDNGFSVLFPETFGKHMEDILYSDDLKETQYIYAVDPTTETVYEICVSKETGYLEDLDQYMSEVGDA